MYAFNISDYNVTCHGQVHTCEEGKILIQDRVPERALDLNNVLLSWLQGIPSFIQYPSETTGFVQTAGEAGLIVQQKLSEDDQDVPNVGEVDGLLDVGHADGGHIEVQDGQIDNKAVCEDGLVME